MELQNKLKVLKQKLENIKMNNDLILSYSSMLIFNDDFQTYTEASIINSTAHHISDVLYNIKEYLKEIEGEI